MGERTLVSTIADLDTGEITSVELCRMYLARIERIDRAGPRLNSVIEVNPEALAVARERDRERRAGRLRGPLHGAPILLKDNIDTHDSLATTAGSLALVGAPVPNDAELVRRLRAAGAVILGKTNLSEWANFRGHRSVSGWSSRGGLTRNPYALDRSACGSSSGSGAAVAADLAPAAVGTETDGSIVCPAQTNGIVGMKPTLGLVSRTGVIPIASSQDTAGPMTRTVADAALLLAVMAGPDARDAATRDPKRRTSGGYTVSLDTGGLRGARLGVARHLRGTDPRVHAVFERALEALRDAGAVLVDPVRLPGADKLGRDELVVLHHELAVDLGRYLRLRGGRHRTLADVIRFNEENRDSVLAWFGQEHMIEAEATRARSPVAYREALARGRERARRSIDGPLGRHALDAIVAPTGGPAWTVDLVNGDHPGWDIATSTPAAVAGYPHITVPSGFIHGLPVGLSFFSTAWREPVLFRLAYAFEQATRARRPPRFARRAR